MEGLTILINLYAFIIDQRYESFTCHYLNKYYFQFIVKFWLFFFVREVLLKNKTARLLYVTISYDFFWPETFCQGQYHLRVSVFAEKTKGMNAEKKQENLIIGEQHYPTGFPSSLLGFVCFSQS